MKEVSERPIMLYAFIAAVIITGIVVGVLLQRKLRLSGPLEDETAETK